MHIHDEIRWLFAVVLFPALLNTAPQPQQLGLYDEKDQVVILTGSNFNEMVIQQNRSALVEFYNSYCGHCKRFAPSYKLLADQLQTWRDVLLVCALDCAVEENNDVCREYEIMAYPTMRYFGPGYIPTAGNYGRPIDTQDLDAIRATLSQYIIAENRTINMTAWPNLQEITENEADSLVINRKFLVLVYETINSTLGTETALRLLNWPDIEVRRVTSPDIATKFQIDGTIHKIAIVDHNGSIVPLSPVSNTVESFAERIEKFLRSKNLTEKPSIAIRTDKNSTPFADKNDYSKDVIAAKQHYVDQADLEMAIRGVLFNEISKAVDINGERLLALQRFLAVLKRYNPLGVQGKKFVTALNDFTQQFSQELSGKLFEDKIAVLESEMSPGLSARNFVGCLPSRPGLRGFTCSLWKLFHFMTVEAARTEISHDPLEVLQAMHDYVKYFFGCTECSSHFQAMATRRKLWNVQTKDDAVLWLWAAHNEVNKRLAGDITEDPEFPKVQFPLPANCTQCYKSTAPLHAITDNDWDKEAVLSFFKTIYNPEHINGLEELRTLDTNLSKLRQKRMTTVFSDMDLHMGMLLYGFCIIMMVVAFKLFAFKGYRKKSYGHDVLGKV